MKFSYIYVCITVYIYWEVNIHQWRINSQKFILDHHVFHNISIDIYKQDRLQTFMVSYGNYKTCPLSRLKVVEIANIQP